jgi:hypothetical protein
MRPNKTKSTLPEMLTLLGCGGVIAAVACFWSAAKEIGLGRGAIMIARDAHPILFWSIVIFVFLFGTSLIISGIRELRALLRDKRDFYEARHDRH